MSRLAIVRERRESRRVRSESVRKKGRETSIRAALKLGSSGG